MAFSPSRAGASIRLVSRFGLISLARVALDRLGEHDYKSHVMVIREGSVEGWGAKDTVLISRKPFSARRYRARSGDAASRQHESIVYPRRAPDNEFGQAAHDR